MCEVGLWDVMPAKLYRKTQREQTYFCSEISIVRCATAGLLS